MTWRSKYDYLYGRRDTFFADSFNMNEKCFIRKEHKCGKIFGASKSCFIACPSEEEIETILELISEKLTKVGVEPIIAVKERAYGQDIFCTKICGKIIESKFCIVILDDAIKDSVNIPNPNVYYEYGLMTSLKKHIIPLQKEKQKLAFNIQSYDTVKYSNKNIGIELDRAIKEGLRITEQTKKTDTVSILNDRTILRKFELSNFTLKDDHWFLNTSIEDTNFKGFGHQDKILYAYVGKIDTLDDFNTYLEDLDVVLFRTIKKKNELKSELKHSQTRLKELVKDKRNEPGIAANLQRFKLESQKKIKDLEERIQLMDNFFICFIINPTLDSHDFFEKLDPLKKKHKEFKFAHNQDDCLTIDDIKINLSQSTY